MHLEWHFCCLPVQSQIPGQKLASTWYLDHNTYKGGYLGIIGPFLDENKMNQQQTHLNRGEDHSSPSAHIPRSCTDHDNGEHCCRRGEFDSPLGNIIG